MPSTPRTSSILPSASDDAWGRLSPRHRQGLILSLGLFAILVLMPLMVILGSGIGGALVMMVTDTLMGVGGLEQAPFLRSFKVAVVLLLALAGVTWFSEARWTLFRYRPNPWVVPSIPARIFNRPWMSSGAVLGVTALLFWTPVSSAATTLGLSLTLAFMVLGYIWLTCVWAIWNGVVRLWRELTRVGRKNNASALTVSLVCWGTLLLGAVATSELAEGSQSTLCVPAERNGPVENLRQAFRVVAAKKAPIWATTPFLVNVTLFRDLAFCPAVQTPEPEAPRWPMQPSRWPASPTNAEPQPPVERAWNGTCLEKVMRAATPCDDARDRKQHDIRAMGNWYGFEPDEITMIAAVASCTAPQADACTTFMAAAETMARSYNRQKVRLWACTGVPDMAPCPASPVIDGRTSPHWQLLIRRALCRVPEDARRHLRARLQENLEFEQMAVQAGLGVETIRERYQHAEELLRKQIHAECPQL